jgi:transketolase
MHDWIFNPFSEEYALSSDWDDRWRTGGRLEDVIDEAHLSPEWVLAGIQRFAVERRQRLGRIQAALKDAEVS